MRPTAACWCIRSGVSNSTEAEKGWDCIMLSIVWLALQRIGLTHHPESWCHLFRWAWQRGTPGGRRFLYQSVYGTDCLVVFGSKLRASFQLKNGLIKSAMAIAILRAWIDPWSSSGRNEQERPGGLCHVLWMMLLFNPIYACNISVFQCLQDLVASISTLFWGKPSVGNKARKLAQLRARNLAVST